jgi:hypothetical protein
MKRNLWFLALVGAILFSAVPALADGETYVVAGGGGVGTKITSVPYTITAPGLYLVTKNLTASGTGIIVNNSGVTIDLMGFTLRGSFLTGSYGIYIGDNVSNVQIRNGTIVNFDNGIYCKTPSSYGHRISNITSIANKNYGIFLAGGRHFIQNCYVGYNGSDGVESIGTVSNCIAEINKGVGIGNEGLITNCQAAANGSHGIAVTSDPFYANIQNNISYNNQGYGFSVGSTSVVDHNTAYNNAAGNYSAGTADTKWGLNAGRP